jgi:hypothetical protein
MARREEGGVSARKYAPVLTGQTKAKSFSFSLKGPEVDQLHDALVILEPAFVSDICGETFERRFSEREFFAQAIREVIRAVLRGGKFGYGSEIEFRSATDGEMAEKGDKRKHNRKRKKSAFMEFNSPLFRPYFGLPHSGN